MSFNLNVTMHSNDALLTIANTVEAGCCRIQSLESTLTKVSLSEARAVSDSQPSMQNLGSQPQISATQGPELTSAPLVKLQRTATPATAVVPVLERQPAAGASAAAIGVTGKTLGGAAQQPVATAGAVHHASNSGENESDSQEGGAATSVSARQQQADAVATAETDTASTGAPSHTTSGGTPATAGAIRAEADLAAPGSFSA